MSHKQNKQYFCVKSNCTEIYTYITFHQEKIQYECGEISLIKDTSPKTIKSISKKDKRLDQR